jgi:hypothetical protein
LLARGCDLRRHLGSEHLPAGMVELVDRAGLQELVGKLRRSLGAVLGRNERGQDLARGNGAYIGAARLHREAQSLLRGDKLGLFETDACELGPGGPGRERQQACHDLPLDIELDRGLDPVVGKARQRRPAHLHHDRLGDPEPVIGGLKPRIVEERDLHGGVGAEWPMQQARNLAPCQRGVLGGVDPHDALVQSPARDFRDGAHAAVRREGLASGEQERARDGECAPQIVKEHGPSLV